MLAHLILFALLHPSESILIKLIWCCIAGKNVSLFPYRTDEEEKNCDMLYANGKMGAMKQFNSLIDLK